METVNNLLMEMNQQQSDVPMYFMERLKAMDRDGDGYLDWKECRELVGYVWLFFSFCVQ